MARLHKLKDEDLDPVEKVFECKWCDRKITEEQYYGQSELCNKCYAEFVEDFGGE